MSYIDLHVHSSKSDGSLSPAKIVVMANKLHLSAIALTDHDTIGGIEEALLAASHTSLEVIPGIEFSCLYQHGNKESDVHILGLFIDHQNSFLINKIHSLQELRKKRNKKIIQLLNKSGISLTWGDMADNFGESIWTRAHFGKYLMQNHYCVSVSEAFDIYLGEDCPCYVPKEKVPPPDIIKTIIYAGGIPILAHPFLYKLSELDLVQLMDFLHAHGLMGIEAIYSLHTPKQQAFLKAYALNHGLLISGGSDFHGDVKPDISMGTGKGNLQISEDILYSLKAVSHSI